MKGPAHHSVAIEFNDHVAIVEAPLNEQRSLAIIEEVRKLAPSKPIRYVINTHPHFDQAGGLRAFVDSGATIITHETNVPFLANALAAPRTQAPDKARAVTEETGDRERRQQASPYGWLQNHGASSGSRQSPSRRPPDGLSPEGKTRGRSRRVCAIYSDRLSTGNLVDNLERLKIDFERIVALNGSGASARPDLYAAIRRPLRDMKEILTAQAPAAAGQRGQRGQAAASSPGREILERACTTCHNLNRVENKNLNQLDWRTIVVRMKDRGAELPDNEMDPLVDFLVKTYGPQ